MTVAMTRTTPACVAAAQVFRSPLLEEPLPSSASGAQRQARAVLVARADESCARCPLFSSCLYDAVVNHDVYGFVAGTTARERQEIRGELGITVQPEDFDTLAGVTAPNRQVDHTEVVRLRTANPTESLESIAQRLGCSLSTVKRHLRRARNGEVAEKHTTEAPTQDKVLEAYASVIGTSRRRAA
ncbi:MAG: WhiB family transcriptional regulator [Propionibacteriaceae bacterium]